MITFMYFFGYLFDQLLVNFIGMVLILYSFIIPVTPMYKTKRPADLIVHISRILFAIILPFLNFFYFLFNSGDWATGEGIAAPEHFSTFIWVQAGLIVLPELVFFILSKVNITRVWWYVLYPALLIGLWVWMF
ncbi:MULTISPECIES: hypothetical protein [Cytobacillus]|uniref:hypothetical protein n=1 Tax=Cytobacillus oceanisediminis TaxID=665099 RepID=UPI001C245EF5|nr:hypothetical protein [Cytobacillus oceanisediminis]MBU8730659.1 hypothetical protein [Cytobacillus oceanisediminis]MCM3243868.1 hypothetical protein [Cytobacillus oceanisediminis]MCM3391762.1 hypothetical protein [Cytobacillus oceanisediminis]MCS0825471.1 hypothetical protein [Cytobacillus firmus]